MKAIAFKEFGGSERLELVDLPTPKPGDGEVLIRVAAAGINPVDWKIREGRLAKMFPHEFPIIPGWEVAGVVESSGAGATRFHRGDRVWAYVRKPTVQWGAYAEYVTFDEKNVAPMPASMLFHEAGAVPLTGLTALQAMFDKHGGLTAGQRVLVHGAAGGVGHLAVQLATSVGAVAYGTASAHNRDFVLGLGAAACIDYANGDFRDEVRKLCPEGVDLVVDTVGGETQVRSFDVTRRGGRIVSVSGTPDAALCEKHGVIGQFHFVYPSGEGLAKLGELADAGKLRVHVSAAYPLAFAAQAMDDNRKGHTRGKIVVVM